MARLFGLKTCPVDRCRVLDIGCGDGLNIIAAALSLPGSKFFGIDLDPLAIRRGQRMVQNLGLRNVRLEVRDLRSLETTKRRFDYVVAHGLYSWLPVDLRNSLLCVVKHVLVRSGVAFVSYNAYPGAYLRRMVREMAVRSAGLEVPCVREWLQATTDNFALAPSVFRAVVADESSDMERREDGALFYDDLAQVNQPVYFRDFMKHAETHGLAYLAEADLGSTGTFGLSPQATSAAREQAGGDRIQLEQLADFFRGRRFRQTLLCHAQQRIQHEPDPEAVSECSVGSPVYPGALAADGSYEYITRLGRRYSTRNIEERFLLETLAEAWPGYVSVKKFGKAINHYLPGLFATGVIDLRTTPPALARRVTARPIASALARLQVQAGTSVTNLHHFEVMLEDPSLREFLSRVDGTHTRKKLNNDWALEQLLQYGLLTS